MNLSTVKSIAVPEGNVTALSIGGVKVWGGGSSGGEPAELYSWEGVAYHINKGTYKDVYAIGDMVPLDLGSEGLINMQIAAFDTDILADGSGTAPITFIAKELLATSKRMNPARAGSSGAYTEGTGVIGGWEKCELRTYLDSTIKPLVSTYVAGLIKTVIKTQTAYNTAGSSFTQTTTDDVWIPSRNEVSGTGKTYGKLFLSASDLSKCASSSTTTNIWWLRDASSAAKARAVSTAGAITTASPEGNAVKICLGFCTGKTPT